MNFDQNGTAYWLTAQEGGRFVELGTDFGQQFTVGDEVRIQTDLPSSPDGIFVTFKPSGRVDPAPVNVKVTDGRGGSMRIICESATELFHIVPNH